MPNPKMDALNQEVLAAHGSLTGVCTAAGMPVPGPEWMHDLAAEVMREFILRSHPEMPPDPVCIKSPTP